MQKQRDTLETIKQEKPVTCYTDRELQATERRYSGLPLNTVYNTKYIFATEGLGHQNSYFRENKM